MADIRGFLQKAYPFLSAGLSLAGPLGNAASAVLGKAIGKPDLKPDGVDEALTSLTLTPELQVQLTEAELQYRQLSEAAGFTSEKDLAALVVEDRASARNMQIQTRSWMPAALAGAAVGTLAFCIYLVAFRNLPESGHDALMLLLGVVVGTVKDVYGYVFGSSAGSAAKTDALTSIVQQK